MIDPIVIDYETYGIEGNPIINPPVPVGVAIWVPKHEPFYLSWGHPEFEVGDPRYPAGSKNNSSWDEAHQYLARIMQSEEPLLFHNAPFDLSVHNEAFCNAQFRFIGQSWRRVHDTMYLLFLMDPYAATYSLKPSADRYLEMPPDEQDHVRDWILANVPEATPKNAMGFICRAPADLVGTYAIGDVVRTRKLFDLLHPKICELGMEAAYDRERRLLSTLLDGTKRGIRIDRNTLEHHTNVYGQCLQLAETRLCARLSCSPDVLASDNLLADALDRAGAVTEWVLTPKSGKRSMARDNLKIVIPEIKELMDYRAILETCLGTFMRPWLELSEKDGRLHPNWNQVRQDRYAGGNKGTRTGRLSSDSPNFQNVPTEFITATGDPIPVPDGLHPPPLMRRYCLPEEGHVWLKRDFSSQEIRILAHFEDGALLEAYRADPHLDPHEMARQLINSMIQILYARKSIKITGFSIIYGSGARGLSVQLGGTYEEAWAIKEAYLDAMPGIRALMQDIQRRGRAGSPIRTWGGRLYYTEPSKEVDGRIMEFSYKLLNYLIQGSAADQTKEAIGDWNEERHYDDTFLATVHDEINISAPKEAAAESMGRLRLAMDRDRFDCPMKSEGLIGENWHDLEDFND